MKNRVGFLIFSLGLFFLILLAVVIFSLAIGPTSIPLKKIISIFSGSSHSREYSILVQIRLPRILLGLAIGGALSISGVILQGLFRNPLVEPYTLGISGGAALGVCLVISTRFTLIHDIFTIPFSGFVGALLVIVLLYFLSIKKNILRIQGLLLSGVMISFIASSLMMLLMSISRSHDLPGIIYWIMGSLDEPNSGLIYLVLVIAFAGLLLAYIFSNSLNAMALGEEEAMHLGINIETTKKSLFLLASLLTGCSVAVGGIIGFVGLVIPHLMRLIFGHDHRILLGASFFAGAAFLIFCDSIARIIISPLEMPVGVITGIIGGSFFLIVLSSRRQQL